MAKGDVSRIGQCWAINVGVAWLFLMTPQMVGAQFFTRVTDVGPIVTDAFLSTGASWNDINNDGWPDLLAFGETSNHFYLNNGDSTFSSLVKEPFIAPLGVGNMGLWADYNNDGYQDLFISNFVTVAGGTQVAPNALYRNMGPPDFDLLAVDLGPAHNASPSASWVDYDQDGDVDLFAAGAARVRNSLTTPDLFYRQDAEGQFLNLSDLSILQERRGIGTHDTWVDYDNDGDQDLFVVNWTFPNELYKSLLMETGNPNRFESITASGLTDEGSVFDIGSSWGDYDNDGDFDVFIPVANASDRLYQNNGDGTFTHITGTPIDARRSVMGVWGDYDNDGDLDLYAGSSRPVLYQNDGAGVFTAAGREAGAIVLTPLALQGGNWGDYDNDGDLDLYLLTYAIPQQRTGTPQRNQLLRNNLGNTNRWLTITCVGTVSNRSGIGAKVSIKSSIDGRAVWQHRYVSGGGSSFVFAGEHRAHFGLGQAATVDSLQIEWPSGIVQVVEGVASNQMLIVTEEVPSGFLRSNFYADQLAASGATTLTVQFTDVSLQDPNTPIVSWAWDFDNNGITDATKPNPTWTYSTQADTTFSVQLTVSNGSTTSTLVRETYITFDNIATGLDTQHNAIPATFILGANHPNPFSHTTTIPFTIAQPSHIQLYIFDLLGRRVATLIDESRAAGRYAVGWEAASMPNGIYVYQLQTTQGMETRQMVLMR